MTNPVGEYGNVQGVSFQDTISIMPTQQPPAPPGGKPVTLFYFAKRAVAVGEMECYNSLRKLLHEILEVIASKVFSCIGELFYDYS